MDFNAGVTSLPFCLSILAFFKQLEDFDIPLYLPPSLYFFLVYIINGQGVILLSPTTGIGKLIIGLSLWGVIARK